MELTEEQKTAIREKFAARRGRQIVVAIVFGIVLLAVYGARIAGYDKTAANSVVIWGPVFLALVVGALGFSFYNWRCPACNGYLGRSLNPRYCSKCGAQLR